MKTATVSEIKRELKTKDKSDLVDLCLRLGKFKKDNKELLTYILFESDNEVSFIASLKVQVEVFYNDMNRASLYYIKKTLRKILRYLDKNIRYSGNKETEVELRIFFLNTMIDEDIPFNSFKIFKNIYERQLLKIKSALKSLHEDLQFDFEEDIQFLEESLDQ